MAFDSDNIGCIGSYSGGKVWMYTTTDLFATVIADGYFSSYSAQLAVGDKIKLEAQDSSGVKHYAEIVFTSVVTTVVTRPIYARIPLALPLILWREVAANAIQNLAAHGGILASNSTPILQFENGATDSTLKLSWAASVVDQIIIQMPLPPDFNAAFALTLHVLAKVDPAGAVVDTPVINGKFYFEGVSTDANANTTGATAAVSTDAYVEYTISIDTAYIHADARTITVVLYPGAHTTDALDVAATWIDSYM